MNNDLSDCLLDVVRRRPSHRVHFVQLGGNSLISGSLIILAFFDDERYPHAVVKMARQPGLSPVNREYELLCKLRGDGWGDLEFLPEPLGQICLQQHTGFVYRAFPGTTLRSLCTEASAGRAEKIVLRRATEIGHLLARLHCRKLTFVSACHLAHVVREQTRALAAMLCMDNDSLRHCFTAADSWERFPAPVPLGLLHGDFSPYNLILDCRDGTSSYGLVDWEHSEENGPLLLDAIRFVSACSLLVHRSGSLRTRSLLASRRENPVFWAVMTPYLRSLGAESWLEHLRGDDGTHLHNLWLSFWTHAALVEQGRSDQRSRIAPSTYVDNLLSASEIQ